MEQVKANLHNSYKLKYWFLLLSLIFHGTIFTSLPANLAHMASPKPHSKYIKLKLPPLLALDEHQNKPIVETPFDKTTTPPKNPTFLANVDHKALKQTRTKLTPPLNRAMDPGQTTGTKTKQQALTKAMSPLPSYQKLLGEALLGFKQNQKPEAQAQKKGGHQDYIDQPQIAEGDVVDLDTREYRFVGYFTHMRKAIEMVWTYPREAAERGQHGKVGIRFTIQKNGKVVDVKIVNSSGYDVLDESIRNAISQAAPFAPLPEGLARQELTISGTFSYVLR